MRLSESEFNAIRTILFEISGVALGADKQYLVTSRLAPVLSRLGLSSYAELIAQLNGIHAPQLRTELVEALTTKETSFNRDTHPFEALTRLILPDLVGQHWQRRQTGAVEPRLRIWSAAASTGQEAYSICMSITDYLRQRPHHESGENSSAKDFAILATDISDEALRVAREGLYRPFDVERGLRETQRRAYLVPEGENWRIIESLRRMVEFRRLNLIQPFYEITGLDLILCRNVLIYFDEPTRTAICRRLVTSLNSGGILMLGASESLPPNITTLKQETFEQTICYRKS